MAVYTEELATDFNFPHINIYRRYADGEFWGYKVLAEEGYVFYDPNANDTELSPDPNNPVEIPVTYYYTIRLLTRTFNMDNFSLVAVPRDSVDENYIFGSGDNNHEIM